MTTEAKKAELAGTRRIVANVAQFLHRVPAQNLEESRALIEAFDWVRAFAQAIDAQLADADAPEAEGAA